MAAHDGIPVIDLPQLREQTAVFADRADAGRVLAGMLGEYEGAEAIVLAIPAGGVPVAAPIAAALRVGLDVATVSKITPEWNTELGYGAVAFDGTVEINEDLLPALRLSPAEVQRGIYQTTEKVQQRMELLRGGRPWPDLRGRTAILVDDGLASGYTMRVAALAVARAEPHEVVVAVPTAPARAARHLARAVQRVYVANLRTGVPFAVADAYRQWSDVSELEAARILRTFR